VSLKRFEPMMYGLLSQLSHRKRSVVLVWFSVVLRQDSLAEFAIHLFVRISLIEIW
jgi:hypothetical protein